MSSTAVEQLDFKDFTPRGVNKTDPLGHICDVCHIFRTWNMLSGHYICSLCLDRLLADYRKWKIEVCLQCTRDSSLGCAGCAIPKTRDISFQEWLDDYLEYYLE